MNALFFSGLLLGLLGANPDATSYHDSALLAGDIQGPTYECSAPCDDSCGDCCDEPCGRPCGRGACGDRTACGPLTLIFSIFKCNTWRGPSCGERYWGDFYSDPPECGDPCDNCGNYTGRATYGDDFGSVRGYSGGGGGGCPNCNKHRAFDDQPIPREGRVISQSTRVSRQPSPTRPAAKVTRIQ
jgi:hypothetical protein